MCALAVLASGCVTDDDAGATPVRTDVVVIPGPWVFEPRLAEVDAGTTVTFVNRGGADHTVTFDALGIDVVLAPGGEMTHTFDEAGRFEYVCKYHPPDMRGAITVTEAGTAA